MRQVACRAPAAAAAAVAGLLLHVRCCFRVHRDVVPDVVLGPCADHGEQPGVLQARLAPLTCQQPIKRDVVTAYNKVFKCLYVKSLCYCS
jgi:hypothetical protein